MEQVLIDMDKLFIRMEEDTDLIREVFEVFIEEVAGRKVKFAKALAEGDHAAMTLHAHSLKGASGTLMAEPLREACYDLERAARAGDADGEAAHLPRVLDFLEKTAARMEELKPTL
jgi:HPt (histidine-containing phosphotransfer) domain-containing protein